MRPGIFRSICFLLVISLSQACSGIFKKDLKEGSIEYKAEAVGSKEHQSITDPVQKIFLSQVFFFEKKQSKMDYDEIKKTNYYLPDYDVVYGTQTKEIAGYTCKN